MKSKTKLIVGSVVVLLLILSTIYLLLPSDDITGAVITADDKTPIKIGYKATSHYLSAFVAQERGFFDEEGLKAELIKFESSNQIMDGVLAGQLDAGRGGIVLQFAIEAENPGTLKTVLVNKQTKENYIDYILVRKDSSYHSLTEFQGTIGTNTGAVERIHLNLVFKKLGLTGIKIVEMKPELLTAALESKQVDAIFTYEPIINIALQRGTARILEEKPIETYVTDPWIGGGVFMTTSFIEAHPETVRKIFRAFEKAGRYIEEHPREANLILMKYTPLDETIVTTLHALPEYSPFEHPELLSEAQENAEMLYQEGYLKKRVDVSAMMLDLR